MTTRVFVALQLCLVLAFAATTFDRFSGSAYQKQTSQQKMDQLWTEITANQKPYGWYSPFTVLSIFAESMETSFSTYSDVIPEGRKKLIHSVGCVAQAEFIVDQENPYSGMFKGASNVLVRMSTAKEAAKSGEAKKSFTPGMGIKLLRDGVPSANLVAMYGVEGHDSWNAFQFDWSNHIPNPQSFGLKVLAAKFAQATPWVGRIGLKTWAKFGEDGQMLSDSDIKFPFKLIFRPTSESRNLFVHEKYTGVFTDQLKTIPVGTALHDVYAVEEPGADGIKIGTIRTKTQFVTSEFGDKHLFFQHNHIEDDIQLHPDWLKAIEIDPPLQARIMREFH